MAPVSLLEGEVRFAVAASRVRRTTESAAQCSGTIAEWTAAGDAAGEINEKKWKLRAPNRFSSRQSQVGTRRSREKSVYAECFLISPRGLYVFAENFPLDEERDCRRRRLPFRLCL